MFFKDLIKKRHSVRSYLSYPVEEEKIREILEAGRLAPSACNNQPLFFVVLSGQINVSRLKTVYNRDWFLNAPLVIVVCINRNESWQRMDAKNYGDVDAAIALDHMILMATECDLGTCWIGAFNEKEARKVLNLPEHIEPVIMASFGYPQEKESVKKRKEFAEIVRWGRYSD